MREAVQSNQVSQAAPGLGSLWNETLGDPQVCIAVVDGPVDQSHPSLVGASLKRIACFGSCVSRCGRATEHGTHVASVIFAQHGGRLKGVAPRCHGLIVPIYTDGPDGLAPCSQLDLARAVLLAAQNGAHIINISGGQFEPSGEAHPLLADAVRHCANSNILIVAAAGNDGCECLHVPGALPSVLAVGAMDSTGVPLESSNWGHRYRAGGILASGENVLGACLDGGTIHNTGTSYATPIVSGIAALLLSLQIKHGYEPDPHAVRKVILASADKCSTN